MSRPPGGITGLPSKPTAGPNMPGPAPPLPAGPPPAQPAYPQQDAQAAHAAAWAAYYAAQGQAGYAAGATAAAPGAAANGAASNPYANYGYSAAATAQHSAHVQSPYPGQQAPNSGPSTFRPPQHAPQAAPYQSTPYAGQQQQYPGYGYPQQPQQAQQPYNAQAGYQWPQPQAGPQQPYRPPGGYQQQPQQQQQPFYPGGQPGQAFSPVRPSPSPGPNRPYAPQGMQNMQGRTPSGPVRPMTPMAPGHSSGPMGASPTAFPPAKRPRFDAPGGQGQPPGPGMNAPMQPRPPRPAMPVMAQPSAPGSFNAPARPSHPLLPSVPGMPVKPVVASAPGPAGAPSGPAGARNPSSNPPPITRPPIHLGFNTPTPIATPFGVSMRGGYAGRGGMRGGARGGAVLNAPRGPAGMRRDQGGVGINSSGRKEADRKRRDNKDKDRYREKEERITMTDFRIVGIEVKGLEWTWGLIGGEQPEDKASEEKIKVEQVEEKAEKVEAGAAGEQSEASDAKEEQKAEAEDGVKLEQENVEAEIKEDAVADAPEVAANVPEVAADKTDSSEPIDPSASSTAEEAVIPATESETLESTETVEEKRGEKRKAKSPDLSEGSSPKKRSGDYLLTHGKPNEPSQNQPSSASAVSDSSQNRFRIYFESPAELDRVPKAMRRNPNKRWRRASSSVAPSVAGVGRGREGTVQTEIVEEGVEGAGEGVAKVEEGGEVNGDVGAEVATGDGQDVDGVEGVEAEAEGVKNDSNEQTAEGVEVQAEVGDAVGESITETTTAGLMDQVAETSDAQAAPVDTANADVAADTNDQAAISTTEPAQELEDVGDVSMRTDGDVQDLMAEVDATLVAESEKQDAGETSTDTAVANVIAPIEDAAAELAVNGHAETDAAVTDASGMVEPAPTPSTAAPDALAQSSENAASAYKSRTRRRSSVSSAGSADDNAVDPSIPTPSMNRVSILYEGSSRRICIDADMVSKVRIHRAEGRIEVVLNAFTREGESKELPKGVLVETYDPVDQRFVPASSERLEELWTEKSDMSVPPFQREPSQEQMVITVWLNLVRPLSEPKWCRGNSADEWLIEQFGARKAGAEGGWRGKLEVMDPDPAPTLPEILKTWTTTSSVGTESSRTAFTNTLSSDPNDLLEILLRLTRGDRLPAAASSGGLGPLATAIRADSPFASHQTHVSLAILAMYRLTTDYAKKAGESDAVVNEKISDIIKSLPVGMIGKSLDGLFREWGGSAR